MTGSRIKKRRQELGLTQQQLANKIGSKKNTISNYECNVSSPSEDVLIQIMDALNCDANYLFGDYFDEKNTNSEVLTSLDDDEQQLLGYYRGFNFKGKEKLLDEAFDMSKLERYKKTADTNISELA